MPQNVTFFLKLLLVIILVVAILIPVNMLYMRGETYSGAQAGMEKFEDVPCNIAFANFGPSYGMSCFNYKEWIADSKACFNFSLTMQDIYHDYSLYQTYADHFAPGAVVAITVSYFTFCSNNSAPSPMRYYKILDKQAIKGYSLENDISANYLPVYGQGSSLARDLLNDLLNSIMYSSATGGAIENEKDPIAALDGDSAVRITTITSGNLNIYGNYIEENKELLINWIKEMQDAGLTPVLVQTPYWHAYANGFDAELLEKSYSYPLECVVQETGVTLLDFNNDSNTDYIHNPEYFNNCDHVSNAGSVEFMRRYQSALEQFVLASTES